MGQTIAAWSAAHPERAPQAFLLGVTPDIARMKWPRGSMLVAVDNSFPMARAVWPGNVAGKRAAACGNWLELPLRSSSRDLVVGDGSMNCLPYPHGFRALAQAVCEVLRDDGLFLLRSYLQRAEPENTAELYEELERGSIGSFHAFKLRLLMALQRSPEEGIAVNRAYLSWMSRRLDPLALPHGPGWEKAAVETIQFYRETDTTYAFPTLVELRRLLRPYFTEVAMLTPSHEMGDRCPIMVLQPCHRPFLQPPE